MELDHVDQLAASAFDGFIVRKDLVRRFKGQYPVPTYVAEFLLGRYCASVDENEINEGLQVVERQLEQRTVRAGEQELFKARARDRGEIKVIDLIKAKLNDRADCFEAELPSLVSDFLSECWGQLRMVGRASVLQDRVFFGGALSGRDTTAAQKTISGLAKLLYPDPAERIPDEDLEWMVRLALECRRRVKEQQKRIVPAEFRNTHFSYTIGHDGVEKFVVTTELQSENEIGSDPLPPGQIWSISPGTLDEYPGLYRIEATQGPGSGVKILNRPQPPAFVESVRYGEQNLYTRAKELVGDRDPREHEFSMQLRAFDAAKGGAGLGLGVLLALCGALLQKCVKGGLVVVGSLNLGGSLDPIHNAVELAELAIDKGASSLLMPITARKQLFNLPDDLATKVDIQFYSDPKEALVKSLAD